MTDATLVIPELFTPFVLEQLGSINLPKLPAMQRLFSRAQRSSESIQDCYTLVRRLLKVELAKEDALPMAALSYLADFNSTEPGWYLRVDPVHLQLGRDKLLLVDESVLQLSADEANKLIEELNRYWREQPWEIQQGAPGRWYLHLDEDPQIETYALSDVVGKNVHTFLMKGPECKRWQVTMNEMQMLLHASSVNNAREAQRQPPINSVWIWGEGSLTQLHCAAPAAQTIQVYSDDPVVRGIAAFAGANAMTLPDSPQTGLTQLTPDSSHIIVMNSCAQALQHGDIGAWHTFLLHFESTWAEMILRAITDGTLRQLNVYAPSGKSRGFYFQLTPRLLKRWWRRTRSLSQLLS